MTEVARAGAASLAAGRLVALLAALPGPARRRGRRSSPPATTEEPVVAATTTTTEPPTTTTRPPRCRPPRCRPSTDLATPKGESPAYDEPGRRRDRHGRALVRLPDDDADRGGGTRRRVAADHDAGAPERAHGLGEGRRRSPAARRRGAWSSSSARRGCTCTRTATRCGARRSGIGRDHTRTPTGSYFVAVIEKPGPARLRPDRAQPQRPLRGHPELAGQRRRHHRLPRPLRRRGADPLRRRQGVERLRPHAPRGPDQDGRDRRSAARSTSSP